MNNPFQKPTGLLGDSFDERDHLADGSEPTLGGSGDISPLIEVKNNGKYVNLYNTYALDQGRGTVSCTAFATTAIRVIMEVLLTKDQSFWLNANQQWDNQKVYPDTWTEGVGDYLVSAPKALRKQPLFWKGKPYGIKEYKIADVSTWKKYLRKGYPILTGSQVGARFIDKFYNWVSTGNKYGHAYAIVGFDDDKQHFIALNSGGRWGHKGTGLFFIKYKDATKLYRGRIFLL